MQLQARHELREARGRVEALLQEKATLEGRLTVMHDADTGPAAMVGQSLPATLARCWLRSWATVMHHTWLRLQAFVSMAACCMCVTRVLRVPDAG